MVQNLPVKKFRIGNIDSAIWENKKKISSNISDYDIDKIYDDYTKKEKVYA